MTITLILLLAVSLFFGWWSVSEIQTKSRFWLAVYGVCLGVFAEVLREVLCLFTG
jgi:uncharacterized membrane protein YbjE (DUF340 family)